MTEALIHRPIAVPQYEYTSPTDQSQSLDRNIYTHYGMCINVYDCLRCAPYGAFSVKGTTNDATIRPFDCTAVKLIRGGNKAVPTLGEGPAWADPPSLGQDDRCGGKRLHRGLPKWNGVAVHQSQKGRENIPTAGTNQKGRENIPAAGTNHRRGENLPTAGTNHRRGEGLSEPAPGEIGCPWCRIFPGRAP
eukprot:1175694-Prorocentrum_minimum.AAC.3